MQRPPASSRWRLTFNLSAAADPTPPTPSPRACRRKVLRPQARGEGAKGVRGIVRRLKMKLPWLKARGLWALVSPYPINESKA